MRTTSATARLLISVAALGVIAGCANTPIANGPERLADKSIAERTDGATMNRNEALNLYKEKAVTILETDNKHAFEIFADAGDEIPHVTVREINASPMNFPELLNQVTEQVGMSWVLTGRNRDELMGKDIYFVQRSETMLESVLEEISKATNSFYRVEDDRIIFSQDELFVTNVPRMAGSLEILTVGIENVGATDVFSDVLTGTISFRADRETLAAVQALMRSFEQGRDMIVYDFWIIERTLSDSAGLGVDIDLSMSTNESTLGTVGGISMLTNVADGATDSGFFSGNIGNVSAEVTASMVRSLGDAVTLARPTISMLSGASSSFESGERSEYIRSISETTVGTTGSSTSGTEVRELRVGINVEVSGAHHGGVISTDVELDVSELIAFDEFDTGEVRLRLPRTSQRKMTAHLEARPGDILALGGIIRDRTEKSEKGLTPKGVPISRSAASEKTETIIFVRPRLVQIRPAKGSRPGSVLKIQSGVNRAPNALGDVISDEARTKRILEELAAK